jgi:hypothetical protein
LKYKNSRISLLSLATVSPQSAAAWSSYEIPSARITPRSKSVRITAATWGCLGAMGNGPGADLFLAGGEH